MHFWRRLSFTVIILTIILFWYRSQGNNAGTRHRADNSHIHLRVAAPRHPVASFAALPSGKAKRLPPIQFDFSTQVEPAAAKKTRLERQAAVEEAFRHAWEGYKFHAFAKDEVTPISGNWRNTLGGWGVTMIDSMDFLWLLGMKGDFDMAVHAVGEIDFSTNTEDIMNVFETTIRYLGGLLAAYDISGHKYATLLQKAQELGDILYMAFDTPNHMPATRWDWRQSARGAPLKADSQVMLAELGSLNLEFTRLSQLTGNPKYFDAVQRISDHLHRLQNETKVRGLWPTIVDAERLDFSSNHFTMGGMVDSVYEYLPKQYLLLGGLDPGYQKMYTTAIEMAKTYLFFRPLVPGNADILFSGNAWAYQDGEIALDAQGQHLSCFIGGMMAIAAKVFERPADMNIARKLVDGCIWAYDSMPSGLMPEVFHILACHKGTSSDPADRQADLACIWDDERWFTAVADRVGPKRDTEGWNAVEAGRYWVNEKHIFEGYTEHLDNRYILRPEAIESMFVLYRVTGDTALQDAAWKMFQAIEKATRTHIAHATVYDVRAEPDHIVRSDRMESFWLAETLKYFWLMFAEPSIVSLDDWVLNTEAHMFLRPQAGNPIG